MPVLTKGSRQVCKLKAETWTHVHVGAGKSLSRWEYYFDQDRLVLLDYAKLADEALRTPDLIDKMVAAADEPGGSLHACLRTRDALTRRRLAAGYRVLPEYLAKADEEDRQIRMLRLLTGSPKCYLPGSTIKGALRTAYMSDRVNRSKDKQAIFARDANDEMVSFKNFQFNIGRPFRDLRSLDNDLFQNVLVRDTATFKDKDIGIAGVNIYARQRTSQRGETKRVIPSDEDEYCEVVLCQSKFEIEMVLRTERLKNKPIKSVVDLLETADRFYRRVWTYEKTNQGQLKRRRGDVADFYMDDGTEPSDEYYLLRMGYGTGQPGTSLLIDYKEFYQTEYTDTADVPLRHPSVYRRNPKLKTRMPYPYTARAAAAGGVAERQPLGWIVIAKDMVVEND
jgi:CRISPR type III-A-associated RAMP protein Csm5